MCHPDLKTPLISVVRSHPQPNHFLPCLWRSPRPKTKWSQLHTGHIHRCPSEGKMQIEAYSRYSDNQFGNWYTGKNHPKRCCRRGTEYMFWRLMVPGTQTVINKIRKNPISQMVFKMGQRSCGAWALKLGFLTFQSMEESETLLSSAH